MNKTTKICLNAMVANEARTITRMLDSCYQYIDYWVIQDNGSTDGTQEIIREYFEQKGIPGFLYEIEWQYPGWNRDHTLQECLKADHGCDWILRMDADERLEVEEDFDWSVFDNISIDSFNICAHAYGTKYFRTWLWNAKRPWFFQHDKRHETIHLPEIGENFQRVTLSEKFRHLVTNDGQTWFAPRKFLKDALELESDKVVGDTIREDTYHMWYVAKSYNDCYGNPDELAFGKDHSDEYARRCIFYFKKYLEYCHDFWRTGTPKYSDEMSYQALIMLGQAYSFIGDIEEAEKYFPLAEVFVPERNEHLMYWAYHLRAKQKYDEALAVVQTLLDRNNPNPFPKRAFLIEDRAYTNSSNEMFELRDELLRKINEPILSSEGVEFDFS